MERLVPSSREAARKLQLLTQQQSWIYTNAAQLAPKNGVDVEGEIGYKKGTNSRNRSRDKPTGSAGGTGNFRIRKYFALSESAGETQKRPQQTGIETAAQAANSPGTSAYVVTLSVTTLLHQTLTKLRHDHFPRSINFQAGHLILFPRLPPTHLTDISLDIKDAITSYTSFPISIRTTPARSRRSLRLVPDEGKFEVLELRNQLLAKWRETFPKNTTLSPNFEPGAAIAAHLQPAEQERAYEKLSSQLEQLAKGTSVWDEEGGTLAGVCTGLTIFSRGEGKRLRFVRRFVFQDVPTVGWDSPENLNIPATVRSRDLRSFAEFRTRVRET